MELKRRFSFRKIFTILYIVAFLVYLGVGFIPADGEAYTISGSLVIPDINLISGVTNLELRNHRLDTPGTIAGSYSKNINKTLLIGHSTTVFKNLHHIELGDIIIYNNTGYQVTNIETFLKSDVNMDEILKSETADTVVIMTCAGELVGEHDATHRLIVTATKI